MKVYLFDAQTGLYEGETFEEADMLAYVEGITTVLPPDYGEGQVPVFDRTRQVWEVVPIGAVRQLLHIPTTDTTEKQS
jgi:hypothetical protein